MNITEVFEYAKSIGEEVEFEFVNLKGETVKCRTLDAWFGFFQLGNGKGFITEAQWKEMTGDVFDFIITSPKTKPC
jgi:hypothetical protein